MALSRMPRARMPRGENDDAQLGEHAGETALARDTIRLRVEDGILMAFGADGDPVPPALLRTACADDRFVGFELASGESVELQKVLALFDAQRKGRLAERGGDRWVEAMLGLGGAFELTPDELLDGEPDDALPPVKGDTEAAG